MELQMEVQLLSQMSVFRFAIFTAVEISGFIITSMIQNNTERKKEARQYRTSLMVIFICQPNVAHQ